jgi:long-chain acyl-CoA synthetase
VERRLWRALQIHFDEAEFHERRERIHPVRGDLTAPQLGLDADQYERLTRTTDSVVHCAASLHRISERACLNVNLRGTLSVVRLAQAVRDRHGLRRFSHVSTVSVAGKRQHEIVREDAAIDWDRLDYDAYSRTKKFGEHLVRELLPDVPITIFRPSIVLGDSRRAQTTQFGMVRAFSILASLPVLPFRPLDRLDIVPVDWVSDAIVRLHRADRPHHDVYHLAAGAGSQNYLDLTNTLSDALGKRRPTFLPALERTSAALARLIGGLGQGSVQSGAKLLDVFFPYLVYDTVFDNSRAVEDLGSGPAPFSTYCAELLRFARTHDFRYPYVDLASPGPPAPAPPADVAPSVTS